MAFSEAQLNAQIDPSGTGRIVTLVTFNTSVLSFGWDPLPAGAGALAEAASAGEEAAGPAQTATTASVVARANTSFAIREPVSSNAIVASVVELIGRAEQCCPMPDGSQSRTVPAGRA